MERIVIDLNEIRILHTGDLHLGSTISGIGSEKGRLRQEELLRTFEAISEKGKESDIVLLAGDIFDNDDCSRLQADFFLNIVSDLKDTAVFTVCGNHDPLNSKNMQYLKAHQPDNMILFTNEISCITLEKLKARVYGVSFSEEHCTKNLLDGFHVPADDYINIMVMHGDVIAGNSSVYNPISLTSIAQSGLDYIALGHRHSYSGVKRIENTDYAYCGIPEGRGFDECGAKGILYGSVCKGAAKLDFIPTAKRNYICEQIDLSDFRSYNEIAAAIEKIALQKENLCHITLVGENNISSLINTSLLEQMCNLFYISCTDNTRVSIDIQSQCDSVSLKGMCAKEACAMLDAAKNEAEAETIRKAYSLISELFEKRGSL